MWSKLKMYYRRNRKILPLILHKHTLSSCERRYLSPLLSFESLLAVAIDLADK